MLKALVTATGRRGSQQPRLLYLPALAHLVAGVDCVFDTMGHVIARLSSSTRRNAAPTAATCVTMSMQ
jgi:hypothetical protein